MDALIAIAFEYTFSEFIPCHILIVTQRGGFRRPLMSSVEGIAYRVKLGTIVSGRNRTR